MKTIPFNNSMIREATEWAENLGGIHNSITRGDGNFAGRLGELALERYIGDGAAVMDRKDYDIEHGGKKIEVKTKRRAVAPKENYLVNVAATSTHQVPDIYAFLSLEYDDRDSGGNYTDLKEVWLCGFKPSKDYFDQATFYAKGAKDPAMRSYKFSVDTYVMPIEELDERL